MISDETALFGLINEASENDLESFYSSKLRMAFRLYNDPVISIIIPVYNKAHLTLACLRSLRQALSVPYEIIIIDNDSRDSTKRLLDLLDNVRIISNRENVFFARACNQGAEIAVGKFLVFLNNDIQVLPGFDEELIETYSVTDKVGAVGGQLINPSGVLQEAGCMVWDDGTPWAYGRDGRPFDWRVHYSREVDYCSAALLMVPRDLYNKLHGMSLDYEPFYFEDTDLQMKIHEAGYKVIYNPFVKSIHHEHGSVGLDSAILHMLSRKKIFYGKWRESLKRNHFSPCVNLDRSRVRNKELNVLIVDNRVPVPEHGGGYPRAYKMINHLLKMQHQFTLFPMKKDEVDTSAWAGRVEELQKKGLEIVQGSISFAEFSRERASSYDLAIVSRGGAFKRVLVDLKRNMPATKVIFDSEAMDFLRNQAKYKYLNLEVTSDQLKAELHEELFLFKVADKCIFISQREADFVSRFEPEIAQKSVVIGHPSSGLPTPKTFSERRDFVFLGGFIGNSGLNEHAVHYYVDKVWSLVHGKTGASFNICGSNMPDEIRSISSPGVKPLGFVESTFDLYNDARVYIISHQYCGGIPWKLSEVMSAGLPAVVSKIVGDQMGLSEEQGVLIAADEQEFADKSIALYEDEQLWSRVREQGLKYIQATHDEQKWERSLTGLLNLEVS